MTATASGSSSAVAVLKPVNPSIATTSMPSRQASGRSASHGLERLLGAALDHVEQPSGPVPSRIGVRSMITVTYLSPRRVCRQTCSSTPRTFTPSKRCGSLDQDPLALGEDGVVGGVPRRPRGPRRPGRRSGADARSPSSAHRRPRRDSFARGSAARLVSWRHTCPQPPCTGSGGRGRPAPWAATRTARAPTAGRRCPGPRPAQPQRRHHLSGSTTRHRPASPDRAPAAARALRARARQDEQNVVRSGRAKVASDTSRSSRWAA